MSPRFWKVGFPIAFGISIPLCILLGYFAMWAWATAVQSLGLPI